VNIDKKIKYDVQGGVKNYLGKQKQVKAPLKWQSGPDKPSTELAYITEAEKNLILKANIHGGLENGPNTGPSGIMSLDSQGDMGGSEDKGTNEDGSNNPGNDGPVDTGDLGTEKANVQANLDAVASLGMTNRDRHISNMYTNIKAPTKTVTQVNPHTDRIMTMQVPTTYQEKFESYGNPGFGKDNLGFNFAPTKTNLNLKSALFNAALFAINPALHAKYGKVKSVYNAAKFASEIAQTFGITDTNVAKDFVENITGSLTSKGKTTSKTNDNKTTRDGDGDGIGSTPEMAALRDEYYLLLQKLQTGNILDAERNRLTALKNLLRI